MRPLVVALQPHHWPAVRTIYEEGIAGGNATFETRAPSWQEWDQSHMECCRLVALDGERVLGWAALSPVTSRCVYSGVAEASVYVAGSAQGQGVGKQLLQALIRSSEEAGIWTVQASMFPENVASQALHRACGFRVVGQRERIAQLNGRWRDTILMERRSTEVGQ